MSNQESTTQPVPPTERGTVSKRGRIMRPLAPVTYLLRNAGKTIPLTSVIMLAVLLVSGIIAMINSIPYSIRTIYRYSVESLGLTPRGDPTQTGRLVAEVEKDAPVPIDRIITCRVSNSQVRSIVGKWPFVMIGMESSDMAYYLARQGSKGLEGRMPEKGKAEAVVSRPVARNLGLKLGDPVQGPELNESYSPEPVRVVGIADTERWIMVNDLTYHQANHFPPIDVAMVFARNLSEQRTLDLWAEERFKGQRAQVWAYHQIEKNTNEMFETLYKILNVVIGTLVLVITFMMGMLMNIYQSQRLVEFGLLQAIGYTKKQILRRVITEAITVVVVGWMLGVVLSYVLLNVVKRVLMDPSAFALNTQDPVAFAYTIPAPIAILLVAVVTFILRFRKFDPVGVVERRLV